jgi:hypothetical protein
VVAPRFPDVNGDGVINATDALNVINYLNSRPAGEGEGDAEGEGNESDLFGLSSLMAGANLSATPITPATRNYTELRLGDFLHLSSVAPMGPAPTANAWWDESELVSEGFVDALSGAYSSEFTDSHDELFADLELDL